MSKKVLLLTFVSDSETDIGAVFDLQKVFLALPEKELERFDVFHSVDYLCDCGDTWCGNREGYGCGKKVLA